MNEVIYLKLKSLNNHELVSYQELCRASREAFSRVYAANDVADSCLSEVDHFLNEYFKITGENKQDYLDKIEAESK
jgi:hypothetical protein